MEIDSLRRHLAGWHDVDYAEYLLAISIGLVTPEQSFQTDVKWVFWSNNVVENKLRELLDDLVKLGFLEKNNDLQYRYNLDWDINKIE